MKRCSKTERANLALKYNSAIEHKLGPIEQRAIDNLKLYENNPRQHSQRQLVQLAASIDEFGFLAPVLIDGGGLVIAGHARIEAAKRVGMKEVPTISVVHLTPAQVKAYRLADNRLSDLASWSDDLLRVELAEIVSIGEVSVEVLGWNTGEVDTILSVGQVGDGPDPIDDIPEPKATAMSRLGDLWCLGKHRLLHGSSLDATAWATLLDGHFAAMAFLDPPYNVPVNGHVSGSGRFEEFEMASGEMSPDEFILFNENYLRLMTEHLKPGAVVMVCMDHKHIFELMTAARRVGLEHLNLCVWRKTNAGMGSLYRSQHELVLILKKAGAPHTNNVELGRNGRWRSNVWTHAGANSFGPTRDQDLADHPTVKPTGMVAEAIRDVSVHGEIVVDAFSGSGTTLLACERTGRTGYAIEIEGRYIDVAIRRWEKMTGERATLIATDETFQQVAARRATEDAASADDNVEPLAA